VNGLPYKKVDLISWLETNVLGDWTRTAGCDESISVSVYHGITNLLAISITLHEPPASRDTEAWSDGDDEGLATTSCREGINRVPWYRLARGCRCGGVMFGGGGWERAQERS
jgi:hypothetical protein